MKMKNKLLATAVMLVISIIMMSTASFAWFTISTAPEVSGMTTTVVTNENLEIAYASTKNVPAAPAAGNTGNQITWGNIVDFAAATDATTSGAYTALDKTLRPIAFTSGTFNNPTYGTDGRVDTLAGAVTQSGDGMGTLVGSDDKVYGYYVDLWIRSNVAGNISLSEAKDRSSAGEEGEGTTFTANGETDADKTLADNIMIASSVLGSATEAGTAASGEATTITPFTKAAGDTNYSKTFTGTVVSNATANTAYLVRIYVYLDGANVTNAAASITGTTIGGAINLQFTNSATTSMDATAAAGS